MVWASNNITIKAKYDMLSATGSGFTGKCVRWSEDRRTGSIWDQSVLRITGRIPGGNGIGRNIVCDDTSGTDDGTLADCNAF